MIAIALGLDDVAERATARRLGPWRAALLLAALGLVGPSAARPAAPAPGRERLFDIRSDPHQLHDLSSDPDHVPVLGRMRRALDAWLERTEDWSRRSEDAMVASFRPDGSEPVTPSPTLRVEDRRVAIEVPTKGVSIGYRIDGGRWRLYNAPFEVATGARLEARAVRYGWMESGTTSTVLDADAVEPR